MAINPLLTVFVRSHLCRYLEEGEAQVVLEKGSTRRLRKGEPLFAAGDAGESMFVILQGMVSVYLLEAGSKKSLADLRFGDVIGEFALIDNQPRSAFAVAVEDSALYELSRDQLLALMQADGALSSKVLWAIMETMTLKFRKSLSGYQSLMSQMEEEGAGLPRARLSQGAARPR